MKHTREVTISLVVLFIIAQIIGLGVISKYSVGDDWKNLPLNIERPKIGGEFSYTSVLMGLIFATILAFILIKFEARIIWKIWFFLSVWFTLMIAFGSVLRESLAFVLGLGLALWKIFKNNVYVHNLTELFIYGGLAAIFVPILNVMIASIILVAISIYDYIAVRKTKHMIKLAKFQTAMKVFAGLYIPYSKNRRAILGGGDIGFPLLFTGAVFMQIGWNALYVTFGVTISLGLLLYYGRKGRYYPAMPYLTAGCFGGYLLWWVISLL